MTADILVTEVPPMLDYLTITRPNGKTEWAWYGVDHGVWGLEYPNGAVKRFGSKAEFDAAVKELKA